MKEQIKLFREQMKESTRGLKSLYAQYEARGKVQ